MPGIDGLELGRRVRGLPHEGYIYIILVTSLNERDDIRSGMHAGADDYLSKPLDPFELETCLLAAQRVTALHGELARNRNGLELVARSDPR